jgi:hypothetical protein
MNEEPAYVILSGTTTATLECRVNAYMDWGYIPIGGLCSEVKTGLFHQAVVRPLKNSAKDPIAL